MNKKSIVRYTFLTISVALMLIIFFFSAQNGTQSGGISERFSKWLAELLHPVFPSEAVIFLTRHIRKIAHVFIYLCLGISVSVCVFTFPFKNSWLYFLLPVLVCFLYACSDELHQLFVSGREGTPTDVLIDSIGFVSAVIASNFVRIFINNKKKKGCNR